MKVFCKEPEKHFWAVLLCTEGSSSPHRTSLRPWGQTGGLLEMNCQYSFVFFFCCTLMSLPWMLNMCSNLCVLCYFPQLKPLCVRALSRIFYISDEDNDHVLSDLELNRFQVLAKVACVHLSQTILVTIAVLSLPTFAEILLWESACTSSLGGREDGSLEEHQWWRAGQRPDSKWWETCIYKSMRLSIVPTHDQILFLLFFRLPLP